MITSGAERSAWLSTLSVVADAYGGLTAEGDAHSGSTTAVENQTDVDALPSIGTKILDLGNKLLCTASDLPASQYQKSNPAADAYAWQHASVFGRASAKPKSSSPPSRDPQRDLDHCSGAITYLFGAWW